MPTGQETLVTPGLRALPPVFSWREIGQACDLEPDYAAGNRPHLVSEILRRCAVRSATDEGAEGDDPDAIWQLSVAARTAGLLAIYSMTDRTPDLPLTMQCTRPECGEPMEVSLPVADLIAMAQTTDAEGARTVDLDGAVFQVRPARGGDQRLWQQQAYTGQPDAEAAILATLVTGPPVFDAQRATLNATLSELDPLSAFELAVHCPECGASLQIPVDLEAACLRMLSAAQNRMICQVDALARRYGWSEAEVFAVPAWRRRRYLALGADDGWPA